MMEQTGDDSRGRKVAASRHRGRLVPVQLGQSAVIVIDCQEMFWEHATDYSRERMKKTLLPNTQALLRVSRAAALETIFVVIESLTKDCRDSSLDYKLSDLNVPRGSPKAQVLPEIAPHDDEIVLRKTSCSVFCSTNIDYVLRNLGMKHLLVVGVLTNQCVESAVRDASDLGYMCTVVDDCCAAPSEPEHTAALHNLRGFARVLTQREVCDELEHLMEAKNCAS